MTRRRRGWPGLLLPGILASLLLAAPLAAAEQYWVYTVRPGDTIWGLTDKYCTSVLHWKRIQRLNNLPDIPARGILPGTRLKFPVDILKHQPASARVYRLQGTARVARAAGGEQAVTAGLELRSGDRLRVGAGSNVTVRFADGSELLVLGGSDIVFDSLSAYGETGMVDTRIRLQSGQVNTRVKPGRGPGSRYEIITPAAVAAVRGTGFRVAADSERLTARSEVIEGTVAVSGAGTRHRVPAGFGVLAEAGKPPAPPRPLLPAPDLAPQQAVLERLPLQFIWRPLDGAVAYRYQVAASEAFDSLLADERSPGVRGFLPDLPNGDYALRVRGVDRDGLEGLDAVRRFTVAAHPQPPLLTGLNNDTIVRDATPEFSWSQPLDIGNYHVQLARDADFSSLLLDRPGHRSEQLTVTDALQPGRYYWRVASIDNAGRRGPWSDAAGFEYRAVPGAPALAAPVMNEAAAEIHWQTAGPGMRYRFQLDTDPGFPAPSVDRQLEEPRIALDTPVAGRYYFRVRAIDETGYASPWSTTQAFTVPGSPWQLLIPAAMLLLL